MIKTGLVILLTLASSSWGYQPPPCSSDIYCYGPLLHTVQMAHLYNDSKTFVDQKMKFSPDKTIELFNELMAKTNNAPDKEQVRAFVDAAFDEPGAEFEPYVPSDWHESPEFLQRIKDKQLQDWAIKLNELWLHLGRKMKEDVLINNEQYSIIHVDHPVIVPGGRFREFYYWDSYWIVRGLLHSEMTETVKGMLLNFLSIVERFGFIPNGGRVYYSMRSQPPLLTAMIRDYVDVTGDTDFIRSNIATLEKEFTFFMNNRTVKVQKDGTSYLLGIYREDSEGPRPESYREDVISAEGFADEEKGDFYRELKSGAESGWDFGSRWFLKDGTNQGNLTHVKTRSIVPVDLNAIIYMNAKLLSDFYKLLNNPTKSLHYAEIAATWKDAIQNVLWDKQVGIWLDYDLINEKSRNYFYPSNLFPLWTGAYDLEERDSVVSKVIHYLEDHNISDNLGGIPTSLENTGQQWDFPNAWPPLQHAIIEGLENSQNPAAKAVAYKWAERWIRSNHIAFVETDAMFEKYDATIPGGHGGGGEYDVQLGFGWSNGVVMDLLSKYGDRLTAGVTKCHPQVVEASPLD